jgi:hypothetical protein
MAIGDAETLQGIFNPDQDYSRWLTRQKEDAGQQLTRAGFYLGTGPAGEPWVAKESSLADGGIQRLREDYQTNLQRLQQNHGQQLRNQRYGYASRGVGQSGGWRGMAGQLDRQYQQQKSDIDTQYGRSQGDYTRQAQELTSRFRLSDEEQQAQTLRAKKLLTAGLF